MDPIVIRISRNENFRKINTIIGELFDNFTEIAIRYSSPRYYMFSYPPLAVAIWKSTMEVSILGSSVEVHGYDERAFNDALEELENCYKKYHKYEFMGPVVYNPIYQLIEACLICKGFSNSTIHKDFRIKLRNGFKVIFN